jgi:hypothetical protein
LAGSASLTAACYNQAIQQDNSCIGYKISEQPSRPAPILSDDKDNKTEKGQQQQEVGEDREQEGYKSNTSCNSDVDNNNSQLEDNSKSKGLLPAKQCQPSPFCNSVIRRGCKRHCKGMCGG